MTYNVFSGTLNSTQSIYQPYLFCIVQRTRRRYEQSNCRIF